jgi:hypothetical protein
MDQNTYYDLKKEESVLDFLIGAEPPKRNHIKPFAYISENELQLLTNISAADLHSIEEADWIEISKNIQKNMERFEFDEKNFQKYAFLQTEYVKFKKSRDK